MIGTNSFEIHCTKELVDGKNQEGMDIEIFEYVDSIHESKFD